MADLEHGLTIHELELTETISGDFFVAIDDGTNTKKAKIANLNSASATSAQTYAEAAAASAASSASSATQAQTSAQSIQSAMVQATSQLQGYVDDAAASASSAAASEANIRGLITSDYAKLARSYATGDSGYREGEETDNAKYYSEQSASYVDAAAAQAVIAGEKADLSEDHAEESEDHALESEGHALGTQNGTPVSSDSPYYHNNAKYWADEARQSSAGGVAARVIATAEPTNISSHAYAIGDQFVYNGILYTATSAISVGDTIAPGTNCSISDTITEQIGNAGHTIVDEEGTELTQRNKLQFKGAVVSDDNENNATVVDVEFLQNQLTEQTNVLGAKNLIPYPYRTTTTTWKGVTYTDNGDGTVTANGTATEESRYYFQVFAVTTPGKKCILSGCPSGGSGSTYCLRAISTRNGNTEWYTDIGSGGITFTVGTSQDTISVFIQVSKGTTVTNLTFKPMLRLASDPDNTYVPYAMTNRELTDAMADSGWQTCTLATGFSGNIKYRQIGKVVMVTGMDVIATATGSKQALVQTLPTASMSAFAVAEKNDGVSTNSVYIDTNTAILKTHVVTASEKYWFSLIYFTA